MWIIVNMAQIVITDFSKGFNPSKRGWGARRLRDLDIWRNPGYLEPAYAPVDKSSSVVDGRIDNFVSRVESSLGQIYALDVNGALYKIAANSGTPTELDSAAAGVTNDTDGGRVGSRGMAIFYTSVATAGEKIFYAVDGSTLGKIGKINDPGGTPTYTDNFYTTNVVNSIPHPMKAAAGDLYVGNGPALMKMASDETWTANVFNPSIPANFIMQDLELSVDGRWMFILATTLAAQSVYKSETRIFVWDLISPTYNYSYELPVYFGSALSIKDGNVICFGDVEYGTAIFALGLSSYQEIFNTGFLGTAAASPRSGAVGRWRGMPIWGESGSNGRIFTLGKGLHQPFTGSGGIGAVIPLLNTGALLVSGGTNYLDYFSASYASGAFWEQAFQIIDSPKFGRGKLNFIKVYCESGASFQLTITYDGSTKTLRAVSNASAGEQVFTNDTNGNEFGVIFSEIAVNITANGSDNWGIYKIVIDYDPRI